MYPMNQYDNHSVNYRSKDYFMEPFTKNAKKREPPVDYGEHQRRREDDTESLDSEGKQKSFTRLCVRFAEKTSMQGIPYINAAKLWYAKILWLILLLGGIAGMTLHLYFLIDQYFLFDVQVSVTLGFNNLLFPAVTVCNVNAVKHSRYKDLSKELQTLIDLTDPTRITPKPPTTGRRKRFVDEYENINFDNLTKRFDFNTNAGTKDNSREITETFEALYMEENRIIRRNAGHQLRDMLMQCSFGGYSCFPQNFSIIQTEKYGNCYTIESKDFIVTKPGPDFGLSMVLYMETEEYLTGISQGYGARVQIHDTNTYPFPADEGFYVPSAVETHIGLKQVELIREDYPYGECEDVSNYLTSYGAKYTRTLCQMFCEQSLIIERCGCFDDAKSDIFKTLNTSFPDRPCRKDGEKECLARFEAEKKGTPITCQQCTNPCNELQFVKAISSRNWPNDEYANVLMQSVCEKLPADKCSRITGLSGDKYSLGKNFLKIVVYFEDLNYERIEEKPEIEVQQFASDVGGAIGLWIGLSIISMFELVQLILECCAYGVHKCKTPPPSKRKRKEKYQQSSKQFQNNKNTGTNSPEKGFQLNGGFDSNWKNV